MNILGLRFAVDTMIVDNMSAEMIELRQLWRDGWIELTRTDTMDTELLRRKDPAHRAELLNLSAEMAEMFGPMVLGQSRIGSCVVGSTRESDGFDRLWGAMHPGSNRAVGTKAGEHNIRDAMHAFTARRYGCNALITVDNKLLGRAEAVKAALDGFAIMSPETALAFVRRMKARHDYRTQNPGT